MKLSQFGIYLIICICVAAVVNMIIPITSKYLKHSEDGTLYSKIMKILVLFNENKVASTILIVIYTYIVVNISYIIKKKLKTNET